VCHARAPLISLERHFALANCRFVQAKPRPFRYRRRSPRIIAPSAAAQEGPEHVAHVLQDPLRGQGVGRYRRPSSSPAREQDHLTWDLARSCRRADEQVFLYAALLAFAHGDAEVRRCDGVHPSGHPIEDPRVPHTWPQVATGMEPAIGEGIVQKVSRCPGPGRRPSPRPWPRQRNAAHRAWPWPAGRNPTGRYHRSSARRCPGRSAPGGCSCPARRYLAGRWCSSCGSSPEAPGTPTAGLGPVLCGGVAVMVVQTHEG